MIVCQFKYICAMITVIIFEWTTLILTKIKKP